MNEQVRSIESEDDAKAVIKEMTMETTVRIESLVGALTKALNDSFFVTHVIPQFISSLLKEKANKSGDRDVHINTREIVLRILESFLQAEIDNFNKKWENSKNVRKR